MYLKFSWNPAITIENKSVIFVYPSGASSFDQPDQLVKVVERDLLGLGQDEGGLQVTGLDGLHWTSVLAWKKGQKFTYKGCCFCFVPWVFLTWWDGEVGVWVWEEVWSLSQLVDDDEGWAPGDGGGDADHVQAEHEEGTAEELRREI